MVGPAINIRGNKMRYVLMGLLCLLILQGCASGSGSSIGSAVQGQSRQGSEGGGDHGGEHGRGGR